MFRKKKKVEKTMDCFVIKRYNYMTGETISIMTGDNMHLSTRKFMNTMSAVLDAVYTDRYHVKNTGCSSGRMDSYSLEYTDGVTTIRMYDPVIVSTLDEETCNKSINNLFKILAISADCAADIVRDRMA